MVKQRLVARIKWLDYGKGIAILAVLLNNWHLVLYTNKLLEYHTIFAVPLFIILAGITSAISISHQKKISLVYTLNRLKKILIPYSLATIIYHFYFNKLFFNFIPFLKSLLMFNASALFYFIFIYCQLILISPVLYRISKKSSNLLYQTLILAIIYFISALLEKHTFMLNIHGGGKYLLGGSYLFLYYFGINFWANYESLKLKSKNFRLRKKALLLMTSLIIILALELTPSFFYKSWTNPPNVYAITYTLIIFVFIYSSYNFLKKLNSKFIFKILYLIEFLGINSLVIYLYHFLFIKIAANINICYFNICQLTSLHFAVWIILASILMPILISRIFNLKIVKLFLL